MKTLLLLRHAKSRWDDPSLADHERPLAPRGKRAGRRIAKHIAHERIPIDVVLCSSASRARATLELIRPELGGDVAVFVEDSLYTADAEDLIGRIQNVPPSAKDVLLIGHNPALQELAFDLAGDGEPHALASLREKFPTGAMATLTTEGSWGALGDKNGYLVSLINPRTLSD
ncbi:MAG: histidine phosphatase family protein [Acidimicrobiales bacterium]